MAGKCDICGKVAGTGHNVSHSKRATNRTWAPNIQKTTITLGSTRVRVRACTRCLRTMNKTKV
ncbi:MAG: 50S ribosomal protein L28 [Chloroflexi bacterium]|nr:50S ribosomal protein L28 [Chloroflexota bacterium]